MDEVTQQNASLVEEASSASKSLQEQAETLSGLVATFTLESNQRAAQSQQTAGVRRPVLQAKQPDRHTVDMTQANWESF
jgi:methyl-accepting chemotaxis protein